MEQALSDTQHRLSVKTNELHAAHETIDKLEDRLGDLNHFFGLFYCVVPLCRYHKAALLLFCALGELSRHGSGHKEDLSALQRSIAALDREKDALQDEVDQKTEKLFELQEENSTKVLHLICVLTQSDRFTFWIYIHTLRSTNLDLTAISGNKTSSIPSRNNMQISAVLLKTQ